MNELICETLEVKPLTEQIYRIRLSALEGEIFDYKGGQYLYLLMPDGKRIPLSIASPPEQKKFLELHIRLIPGHELAVKMLLLFKTAKRISIEGPFGKCYLRESQKDVIIIAGGTGFSPMKSLLESALANSAKQKFHLYLGAQSAAELYQSNLILAWNVDKKRFQYTPVINNSEEGWSGEVGFPHEIALANLEKNISEYDFYISGSEKMVMNVYQTLLSSGVNKQNVFSDILDIKREFDKEI